MKKADIELDSSIELILIIFGLILLLLLVAGIILNIQSMGDFLKNSMGSLF